MVTTRQNGAKNVRIPVKGKKRREPTLTLKDQKAIAKMGMAGSLGALFVSGFFKFQGAKSIHIYSGLGLLVFTVWHHFINQPEFKSKR